jgi:hypothetical protein
MKNRNILVLKLYLICILIIRTTNLSSMIELNHPIKPKPIVPITLQSPVIKGQITTPQDWLKVPEFRIFFNGKQTINDKEGLYSFPVENKDIKELHFLICKQLNTNFDSINTIKNIQIKPENNFRFFTLTKAHAALQDWEFKEETKLDKKKFVIPQNCVIFLINPKYVDHLKNWNLKSPENMIKLPQIIFKENFKEQEVVRQADKSIIRALDLNAFHENVDKKIKKEAKPKLDLALVQPN